MLTRNTREARHIINSLHGAFAASNITRRNNSVHRYFIMALRKFLHLILTCGLDIDGTDEAYKVFCVRDTRFVTLEFDCGA